MLQLSEYFIDSFESNEKNSNMKGQENYHKSKFPDNYMISIYFLYFYSSFTNYEKYIDEVFEYACHYNIKDNNDAIININNKKLITFKKLKFDENVGVNEFKGFEDLNNCLNLQLIYFKSQNKDENQMKISEKNYKNENDEIFTYGNNEEFESQCEFNFREYIRTMTEEENLYKIEYASNVCIKGKNYSENNKNIHDINEDNDLVFCNDNKPDNLIINNEDSNNIGNNLLNILGPEEILYLRNLKELISDKNGFSINEKENGEIEFCTSLNYSKEDNLHLIDDLIKKLNELSLNLNQIKSEEILNKNIEKSKLNSKNNYDDLDILDKIEIDINKSKNKISQIINHISLNQKQNSNSNDLELLKFLINNKNFKITDLLKQSEKYYRCNNINCCKNAEKKKSPNKRNEISRDQLTINSKVVKTKGNNISEIYNNVSSSIKIQNIKQEIINLKKEHSSKETNKDKLKQFSNKEKIIQIPHEIKKLMMNSNEFSNDELNLNNNNTDELDEKNRLSINFATKDEINEIDEKFKFCVKYSTSSGVNRLNLKHNNNPIQPVSLEQFKNSNPLLRIFGNKEDDLHVISTTITNNHKDINQLLDFINNNESLIYKEEKNGKNSKNVNNKKLKKENKSTNQNIVCSSNIMQSNNISTGSNNNNSTSDFDLILKSSQSQNLNQNNTKSNKRRKNKNNQNFNLEDEAEIEKFRNDLKCQSFHSLYKFKVTNEYWK